MRINPKQIVAAWITSFNPSTDEKLMAEERKKVCMECPSKKEILKEQNWSSICSECGCPINKKVFTLEYNACPLKKWENVDNMFFTKKQTKLKRSIT